ncbi:MAG: hypothetical protein KGI60_02115 [Patescibacteria group bacterium]|nr:hypothetical protein [Patescibacteria group bacterium]
MNNKMTWVWVGVIVVLAAVGLWFWMARTATAPTSETAATLSTNDSTTAIAQELQNTAVPDPSSDIQSTNADVNSL